MSNSDQHDKDTESQWKLPDGIENVIESGIVKATIGAGTGAVLGSLLFKSGKGWRSASIAMGVGVAVGSSIERALCSEPTQK